MSIISIELAGSNQIKQSSEGKRSAVRTWFVYDDGGADLVIDDIINASGLPQMGQLHPDIGSLWATSWDVAVSNDRAGAWEVSWNYTSGQPAQTGGGSEDELAEDDTLPDGLDGYSMTLGVAIIDIWRAPPRDMPYPGLRHAPTEVDIGGTSVSTGGLPISFPISTAEIRIRERVTGFVRGIKFAKHTGTRNSESWQGFAHGSLLYAGTNVNHTRDGVNEIEHTLHWDNWFHLRQVPVRDDDGNVVVDGAADPPTTVYWKQPFGEVTNFNFLPM